MLLVCWEVKEDFMQLRLDRQLERQLELVKQRLTMLITILFILHGYWFLAVIFIVQQQVILELIVVIPHLDGRLNQLIVNHVLIQFKVNLVIIIISTYLTNLIIPYLLYSIHLFFHHLNDFLLPVSLIIFWHYFRLIKVNYLILQYDRFFIISINVQLIPLVKRNSCCWYPITINGPLHAVLPLTYQWQHRFTHVQLRVNELFLVIVITVNYFIKWVDWVIIDHLISHFIFPIKIFNYLYFTTLTTTLSV